jgi:sulfite exporter TauE/SafE
MAIAGAIGTGSTAEGAIYMILFGLGTIPMMLSISVAGNMISQTVRRKINQLIPVLVVVVGLLFVLRGLSLGIPYLSPEKQMIEKKFEKSLEKNSAELLLDSNGNCCSKK